MPVTRILTSIVLTLCFVSAALAQDSSTPDAKTQDMLNQAKESGRQVQVAVNGNVSAQAVLIPQVDARRIFGKEVADNYAVIEVNVSNKSQDATLLIHNIYIDYSRWALSGSGGRADFADDDADHLSTYQASSRPSRVASVERRVVRGQLLDAQLSTKRNRWIKWLTLAGSVAAAYTFSLNERGIIRGISTFNGVVIPGLNATFPDPVIAQLNRISDFGFATNMPVSKQGGEVVICFFPIDRFLTPGFRALFLKSPALFFAPLQMLVDDTITGYVDQILGEDLGLKAGDVGARTGESARAALRRQLPCYLRIVQDMNSGTAPGDTSLRAQIDEISRAGCLASFGLAQAVDAKGTPFLKVTNADSFKSFVALDYLSQASLNHVKVTIDGVMSVDTSVIPAKIDEVAFDDAEGCGGPDKECFWTVPSGSGGVVRTGTIKGSYLTNGSVAIVEQNDLHIQDVQAVAEGSNDQLLHFSMKLTQTVDPGKTLTFKVTKPRPGVTTKLESQPWIYVVSHLVETAPTVEAKFDAAGNTLTVINLGLPFTDADANSLNVALVEPDLSVVKTAANPRLVDGKLTVDLPASPPAGCWRAIVQRGNNELRVFDDKFVVLPPKPTLLKAAASAADGEITVNGTGFSDITGCDGKPLVHFQLVEVRSDNKPPKTIDLKVKPGRTPTDAKLVLPPDAQANTKWVVQVVRDDEQPGDDAKQAVTVQ